MGIGRRTLAPERSNHILASIEHRLDDRTRIRAEVWSRDDRDLLARLRGGWMSYAYGRSEMRDGITGDHYDASRDQLHTVNLYAQTAFVRPAT